MQGGGAPNVWEQREGTLLIQGSTGKVVHLLTAAPTELKMHTPKYTEVILSSSFDETLSPSSIAERVRCNYWYAAAANWQLQLPQERFLKEDMAQLFCVSMRSVHQANLRMAVYVPDSFDELATSGSEINSTDQDLFNSNNNIDDTASNTITPEPGHVSSSTSVSHRLFSGSLNPDITRRPIRSVINNSTELHSSEILEELI